MQYANKNKRGVAKLSAALGGVMVILTLFFVIAPAFTSAQEAVGELNEEIVKRRQALEELQKQINGYQQEIQAKQKEARSLTNQVAIIQNQIAKLELDIEATEQQIGTTNLEIQVTNVAINEVTDDISDKKEKLTELVNLIYRNDQVSLLEVLLTQDSFSELYDYFKSTQQLHGDVKGTLDTLKQANLDLNVHKANLELKKQQEEELKDELLQRRDELDERSTVQEVLLAQTRLTQKQYQQLVYQLQLQQQQANADITSLERKIREELAKQKEADRFASFGPARLSWPVDPGRGITAYFHDPDYPFRYLFEHPAIDIRAAQATPIKAPESGYIGRVKFNGDTGYAYILIVHNDGLSTVFGHISKPLVGEDQFVTKGEIIALSGGRPGSIGAGPLTSGPHLHFEVRLDGIPVNPLEYLPSF